MLLSFQEIKMINKILKDENILFLNGNDETYMLYMGYYKMMDILQNAAAHSIDINEIIKLADRYIKIMECVNEGINILDIEKK